MILKKIKIKKKQHQKNPTGFCNRSIYNKKGYKHKDHVPSFEFYYLSTETH